SAPPPNQFARSGRSHKARTSSQLLPPSSDRNSPPGNVPTHSRPGWSAPPYSSAQMSLSVAGVGGLPSPVATVASAGYAGDARSSHVAPASGENFSFTPK